MIGVTAKTKYASARLILSLCLILFSLLPLVLEAQDLMKEFPESFDVQVSNPLAVERDNILVCISQPEIARRVRSFNAQAFVVMQGANEIPSQFNDHDEINKGIVLVLEKMRGSEMVTLTVRYRKNGVSNRDYVKKTQAELSHKTGGTFVNREYVGGTFTNVEYLRVPKEHKDHSWFIRYEGPGWESDKVGYRFYLDQRNATDVFGKKNNEMVLQQVGQDGFDSYHKMQPWGMDVMKVGKSLGIGSIGYNINGKVERVEKTDSVTCRITENGAVYSSLDTRYYGWQFDGKKVSLRSTLGIHAGARHTHEHVIIDGALDRLCTGIVKDQKAKLTVDKGDEGSFGFIATTGEQSLNNDWLGLAVLFPARDLLAITEDTFSHVVDLKVSQNRAEYYFLAAWSGEPGGITNEADFTAQLKKLARELANPVKVSIVK